MNDRDDDVIHLLQNLPENSQIQQIRKTKSKINIAKIDWSAILKWNYECDISIHCLDNFQVPNAMVNMTEKFQSKSGQL